MSEQDYVKGSRAVWRELLGLCLSNLGYRPEQTATWFLERDGAITTLRRVCAEHGDNDWDETLHLSDIIEKHLARYLPEKDAQ